MSLHELARSGLPLSLDTESHELVLGEGLTCAGTGAKCVGDMTGLLAHDDGLDAKELVYGTYRDICFPADKPAFERQHMRYDITVVIPGLLNGEYKKTSGHYHGWNADHTHSFAEIYEVLSGTALFMLQKASRFEEDPAGAEVEDVIAVRVEAGQTLLVPPDYGHASINIGEGALVFSNIAYLQHDILYDSVKAHRGMAYYAVERDGELTFERNPRYTQKDLPAVRVASVHDNPALGIDFDVPAYRAALDYPERFDFFPHPGAHIEEIMALLDIEEKG